MSIIEVKDLYFSYKEGEEILKGINLTFDGCSTAIIGQNGAGKTTLVKLIKGLLKPTKGDILFNHSSINNYTVAQLAKHIGMVFQNPNDQIFKNNVMDEVMFGPLQIGMDKDKAHNMALKALEMTGLLNEINANPYDLGLSRRKLVAIASILAMDTEVIILDEPTIAQDYAGKERIKNIIHKLKENGKTVITIIHDMNFVADVFDRAVVFAEGNVLLDDTVKNVFLQKDILNTACLEQPDVMKLCFELNFKPCLNMEEFIASKYQLIHY